MSLWEHTGELKHINLHCHHWKHIKQNWLHHQGEQKISENITTKKNMRKELIALHTNPSEKKRKREWIFQSLHYHLRIVERVRLAFFIVHHYIIEHTGESEHLILHTTHLQDKHIGERESLNLLTTHTVEHTEECACHSFYYIAQGKNIGESEQLTLHTKHQRKHIGDSEHLTILSQRVSLSLFIQHTW